MLKVEEEEMNENFYKVSKKYFDNITDPEKELRQDIRFMAIILFFVFLIIIIIPNFFYERVVIEQNSMYPTIQESDRVGVLKVGQLKYGDIVVFYRPLEQKYIIKRLMGKEGDSIWLERDNETGDYYIHRIKVVKGKAEEIGRAHV